MNRDAQVNSLAKLAWDTNLGSERYMLMRIFEWRQLLREINNQQIECNQGGVLTTTWTSNKIKYSFSAQDCIYS